MRHNDPLKQIAMQAEEQTVLRKRNDIISGLVDDIYSLPEEDIQLLRERLREGVVAGDAPKTPSELWKYCKLVYGFEIPITACSSWTVSPMQWAWDFYIEKYTFTFAIGNRGGGKTYPASFLIDLKCRTRQGYEAIHVAAQKEQAIVSSNYLRNFYNDTCLQQYFKKQPAKFSAEWINNSTWKIVAGKMSAVSGQHPHSITLDEIEFWDIPALEQTFAVPQDRDQYRKFWAAFSTRQRSFGTSNYLTREIESGRKEIKTYIWNIFETLKRCPTCLCKVGGGRIDETKCNLWEDCKGEKGTKATGWVSLHDAQGLKAALDRKSWETQYLCSRPSSHGLVLHNFEHTLATDKDLNKGNYFRYQPDFNDPYYCTHDPAEGNTSVLIFWQIVQISPSAYKIFVFDSIVIEKCANTLTMKKALYEKIQKENWPDPKFIIVDPHKPDSVADWRAGDINGSSINKAYYAVVPDMTKGHAQIEPGLDLLRLFVEDPHGRRHLYIDDVTCPRIVIATKEHHYKLDKNNELSANPVASDEFKDEIDTLRYTVIYVVTKMGYKTPGITNRKLSQLL